MMIGGATPVMKYDGSTTTIPVAGEITVYTRAFPLHKAVYFGIWCKFTSATGTPAIKVELEESYSLPTTEGSAETTLWVEPDGFSDIFESIADELAHIKTVSPIPMVYGRYKITGTAGNPADTVGTIFNFLQEEA